MVKQVYESHEGGIPNDTIILYIEKLINRIYKILPLYENKEHTLYDYIKYLVMEVKSGNEFITNNVNFFEIIINLNVLLDLTLQYRSYQTYKEYRSQVFKCIDLCKKSIERLRSKESYKGGDYNGI